MANRAKDVKRTDDSFVMADLAAEEDIREEIKFETDKDRPCKTSLESGKASVGVLDSMESLLDRLRGRGVCIGRDGWLIGRTDGIDS